jgi:hypothetical protein
MSDPKEQLPSYSEDLLRTAADVRETEQKRRNEPIASPEFDRLGEDVTRKAHDVYNIAQEQEAVGNETEPGGETIEDVERKQAN